MVSFLLCHVGEDALENSNSTELVDIIFEDVRRSLAHCGFEHSRLLALQIYYQIDSKAKLNKISGTSV